MEDKPNWANFIDIEKLGTKDARVMENENFSIKPSTWKRFSLLVLYGVNIVHKSDKWLQIDSPVPLQGGKEVAGLFV